MSCRSISQADRIWPDTAATAAGVGNSNINVGGTRSYRRANPPWVRGVGLIRSIDDLASTMVSQSGAIRCWSKDIATVTVGEKPRSASPG